MSSIISKGKRLSIEGRGRGKRRSGKEAHATAVKREKTVIGVKLL